MKRAVRQLSFLILSALVAGSSAAHAAFPYAFPGPPVIGAPGPVLPAPGRVIGKEFSDSLDRDMVGLPDPAQVVAWDGVGGVTDGVDFSGVLPAGGLPGEIDALAHRRDLLHNALRADSTYLLFSHGNGLSPAGTGSLVNGEGETIGFAGDVSYEAPGSISKGIWASGPMLDGMTTPFDVDGLEIWGPEPPISDADRFSLADDAFSGISVYTGTGAPYISHATIIGAVTSLLGPFPGGVDFDDVDLDALMSFGSDDDFGPGDAITFSIRQITDSADPDGFYATGSEIFTLDFSAAGPSAGFLAHGGHLWDHTYSLGAMTDAMSGRQLDINAIEAVSVPEPSAGLLGVIVALSLAIVRRRGAQA
ncbi:MAG: hypothetical protein AAGF97_08770 [Planctomycetota bacterium]